MWLLLSGIAQTVVSTCTGCLQQCRLGALSGARPPDGAGASAVDCKWQQLAVLVLHAVVPLAARPTVAVKPVHSLAQGLVGRMPDMAVRMQDERMEELVRMVAASLRHEHPTACFTTLQINKGFAAAPHVDAMNWCKSYCSALGD